MARSWMYWAGTVPSVRARRSWWSACTLVILAVSLIPGSALQSFSLLAECGDKCLHFAMYAAYALAACWAWSAAIGRQPARLLGVATGCALYGMLMEVLQGSIPGLHRQFSAADAAANTLGAATGAWLWFRAVPADRARKL